jgi:hypothetical protein
MAQSRSATGAKGVSPRARGLALEGSDVEAAEVLRLEGPHRQAEGAHGGIDGRGRGAGHQQPLGLGARHLQDAVADKTIADAGANRDFPKQAGERKTGRQNLRRRRLRRHDLQKLHDVGGAEEVQAEEAFGMADPVADRVRIEIGGVGGQHRIRPADRRQFFEDGALDGEILEHRLDDEIYVGQQAIILAAGDAGHALIRNVLRHAPALHRTVINGPHIGKPACDRRRIALDENHRQAGMT